MAFQKKLLAWFEKNKRPLPWRKRYRPYEVWISEIMLQQTQMETVLPYYERWMKAFPTLEALADAPEEKVLKAWQGLGYYSRARNLRETARRIVENFAGKFPSDFDSILSLKGIGPYTAGAIASIAFNQDKPIVDGNVLRVLSRLFAIQDPVDSAAGRAKFWALEESLIPKGRARDFNQALMEHGALVCTPKNPKCPSCPVNADCRAFREGKQEAFPVKGARKKTVRVAAGALVWKRGADFFLHRRPAGAIMGGLWEFPEWKLAHGKEMSAREAHDLTFDRARSEFGTEFDAFEPAGTIKRNYTHHLETLYVFTAEGGEPSKDARGWPSAWVPAKKFSAYPFTSAHAKIAEIATSLSDTPRKSRTISRSGKRS